MKLRIRDNSIRLRLTQIEVDTMRSHGRVSSRISFSGGAAMHYVLESSPAANAPSARFSDAVLTVQLPEADVENWASTDQVSIAAEEPLSGGQRLSILVEKDFACLAPREGEDDSDMFPHPLAEKDRC